MGEGALGEASIDQRANCPTFRITRACVVRNVDIDMTGFREAVMVEGPTSLQPLIQGCIIRWGFVAQSFASLPKLERYVIM